MDITDSQIFQRLGSGESIEAIRAAAGMSWQESSDWWRRQAASRLPKLDGEVTAPVSEDVTILRDAQGVPHVAASGERDLLFGYGYAQAQDRLWQMDYLRRRALGTLSEVVGQDALEYDVLARTVGINRIAADHYDRLSDGAAGRLHAFSDGINAAIDACRDALPIEFSLLGYEPAPWTPLDTVAIWLEFCWYLTGRLPVIVLPELAKRSLPTDELFEAFLTPEADDESIVPPGSYPPAQLGAYLVGRTMGSPDDALGSNNWAVSGSRSASGMPLVASDPHIAFGSTGCWYQVHLHGAGFDVAGAGYAGVPGILIGRNRKVAWGVTNNICSQRDLYQEKTDPNHPDCFLFDGEWQPRREIVEEIRVKDGGAVRLPVSFSRNGPIVDHLLPEPARSTGPVSLRWLGAAYSDEVTYLVSANRAEDAAGFREAMSGWVVPTLSFVFADVDGNVGYQCVGRIPIRENWESGYRAGWDPAHQWRGLIPYDAMPALSNPTEGWVRSANNRTAPDDFPYPLSGTWASGHRAMRVRQMLEESDHLTIADMRRMQADTLSLRAVEALPHLATVLAEAEDEGVRRALGVLRAWDARMDQASPAAAIFESFFQRWSSLVAAERFGEELAPLMAGAVGGLALDLLSGDRHGWFERGDRERAVVRAMGLAVAGLEQEMGADMSGWSWGAIHRVKLPHQLGGHGNPLPVPERGDLPALLNRGGQPVGGSGVTVCNTGYDPNYLAAMGANFRMIVDLDDPDGGLWHVDAAGQSGHPGSHNYCDQLPTWLAGKHHYLPLDMRAAREAAVNELRLTP